MQRWKMSQSYKKYVITMTTNGHLYTFSGIAGKYLAISEMKCTDLKHFPSQYRPVLCVGFQE